VDGAKRRRALAGPVAQGESAWSVWDQKPRPETPELEGGQRGARREDRAPERRWRGAAGAGRARRHVVRRPLERWPRVARRWRRLGAVRSAARVPLRRTGLRARGLRLQHRDDPRHRKREPRGGCQVVGVCGRPRRRPLHVRRPGRHGYGGDRIGRSRHPGATRQLDEVWGVIPLRGDGGSDGRRRRALRMRARGAGRRRRGAHGRLGCGFLVGCGAPVRCGSLVGHRAHGRHRVRRRRRWRLGRRRACRLLRIRLVGRRGSRGRGRLLTGPRVGRGLIGRRGRLAYVGGSVRRCLRRLHTSCRRWGRIGARLRLVSDRRASRARQCPDGADGDPPDSTHDRPLA
jgi:hypothetical protein